MVLPPLCFVLILCMRREQAPALRFITICGAPPCCLFSPFVFRRATTGRPYKNNKTLSLPVGAITYLRSKCAMKRSEILNRPQRCSHYLTATRQIWIIICRAGVYSRRNVVRSLFWLRTNIRLPTNSVGGDVLDAPHHCSHHLSASHKQTLPHKPR